MDKPTPTSTSVPCSLPAPITINSRLELYSIKVEPSHASGEEGDRQRKRKWPQAGRRDLPRRRGVSVPIKALPGGS